LEFFLELVPGGKLSPLLYEVPVGGEVYVRPSAKGMFILDNQSGNRDHFMVATTTGVAPFISMVRNFLALEDQGSPVKYRIMILHSASISAELAYREELAGHVKQRSWLGYVPTVSRAWFDPAWQGERGRAEDVARKYMDAQGFAALSTTAYVCGNPHMIHNMEGILARSGFPQPRIKKENYWPAK
jgi:ferredoxin/flavodoxin---NADP+ reductase